MKKPTIILAFFFALVLFGATDVLAADISFTYVPDYGTKNNLKGKVDDPDYKIAVYILIDGMGWWLKPYANSFVYPDGNGDWECDIMTGGVDEYAIKITAYLLPSEYNPSSRSKEEDEKNSLDKATAIRSARTISFSGYNWAVKSSVDEAAGIFWTVDPGQNYFSHYATNVWVDEQGRLHLKIAQQNGNGTALKFDAQIIWVTGNILSIYPLVLNKLMKMSCWDYLPMTMKLSFRIVK